MLVNLTIPTLGVWLALAVGLVTTVGWNIMLIAIRKLTSRA
jgi:hypothetical protein